MMTTVRSRAIEVALPVWAATTALAAPRPAGLGGWPRAINAIAFLTLGPGLALLSLLLRLVDPVVAGVISVAGSLTVLVLSSQLLLLLGLWSPWGVAAMVATVTVAISTPRLRAESWAATRTAARSAWRAARRTAARLRTLLPHRIGKDVS